MTDPILFHFRCIITLVAVVVGMAIIFYLFMALYPLFKEKKTKNSPGHFPIGNGGT